MILLQQINEAIAAVTSAQERKNQIGKKEKISMPSLPAPVCKKV
jgi:hypothetical protein